MFGVGQLLAVFVIGLLFGAIVQSQAKKKGLNDLGNLGLGSCIAVSFIGAALGWGWFPALLTMIGFLIRING
jgi:uncharacterized membrane protein YraQ (UPF0718 family)